MPQAPQILGWTFFGPSFAPYAVTLLGVLLCAACVMSAAYSYTGSHETVADAALRRAPLEALASAMSGLALGIGGGLTGGMLFEYIQSQSAVGRFTLPGGLASGAALGAGLGLLLGFALARFPRLSLGIVLGTAGGLAAGLLALWLVFGPTSGFGPELDSGVGPEMGLLLGTIGALLGAFVGALIQQRIWLDAARAGDAPERAESARVPRRRWILVGIIAGCAAAMLLLVIGIQLGIFQVILPRVASSPELNQPVVSPSGDTQSLLYGLAIFGTGGALAGGLVAALLRLARLRGYPLFQPIALAAGLLIGIIAGLTAGFSHLDVGGPPFIRNPAILLGPLDPTGTSQGLLIGGIAGLLAGLACAALVWWAERRPERRTLALAAAVLALGITVLLFPHWFHPLFGVDIH